MTTDAFRRREGDAIAGAIESFLDEGVPTTDPSVVRDGTVVAPATVDGTEVGTSVIAATPVTVPGTVPDDAIDCTDPAME